MLKTKPLHRRRIIIIVSLFTLALLGARFIWLDLFSTSEQPKVEDGVLDLSDWDFKKNEILTLDGEWKFLPNKVLTPYIKEQEFSTENTFPVPNTWKDSEIIAEEKGAMGYGSYQLKIKVPHKDEQIYGLIVRDLYSAAKIYEGEKLVYEQGNFHTRPNKHKGIIGAKPIYFTAHGDEINIIVNISNHDLYNRGGIMKSVYFGLDTAVDRNMHLNTVIGFFILGFLILHAIYALTLYFFGEQRKELIYFSLALFSASLYVLVTGDRLLLDWIPLSPLITIKLEFLSYVLLSIFILLFNKTIFYPDSKNIFNVFIYILIATGLTVILALPIVMKFALWTIGIVTFSYLLFLTWYLFMNIRKNNGYTIFILLSLIAIFHNIAWGTNDYFATHTILYYPIDFVLSVVMFTFFVFAYHSVISKQIKYQALELQAVDEKRDEFLMNTSHELRNPLHALINISRAILETSGEELSAGNRENLKLLIKICRRMNFTINDLTDSVRLKSTDFNLYPRAVNAEAVTSGVIDMVSFTLEGKNIDLTLDIEDDFPYLYTDEDRLIQILFNLIHNAIKFTDKGSISVTVIEDEDFARFIVSDTGIGMDEEFLSHIFEPYSQASTDTTARPSGIGLGLSIVKQLVKLQGGSITVQSEPGKGTEFSFTVPLLTDKSVVSAPLKTEQALSLDALVKHRALRAIPSEIELSKKAAEETARFDHLAEKAKILVVDDEPLNLKVVKQILNSEYEVHTAASGQEALMRLQEEFEWDLVISDIMMPYMSGYELTQAIRENYSLAELPVLLLTARNKVEDIHTAFRKGANDYLIKPVDAIELKARVKALTQLRQAIKNQMRTEAAWLQAQIQPHFLFNTLNTIASLSEIDSKRMIDLLKVFGDYLRKSFSADNTRTFVPLEEELDLVKSYLYIEQQRFGDRLNIVWEIDEDLNAVIPPLTIQPIIENAAIHGVLKQAEGGTIIIRAKRLNDEIEISIIDDGIGMDDEAIDKLLTTNIRDAKGVGVSNTNRRLNQLFGTELHIQSVIGEGTTVSFKIPYLNNEEI